MVSLKLFPYLSVLGLDEALGESGGGVGHRQSGGTGSGLGLKTE